MRLKRFTVVQRAFHLLLMLSFLIQALTGFAALFFNTAWGRGTAGVFGGYEGMIGLHKYVGFFMIGLFLVHVLYIIVKIDWKRFPGSLFGPDSLLPGPTDVKQFFQHVGWMIGVAKEPRFDRWGYWEKFDYWAVFWGMVVMGGTGLILAAPKTASLFMPGWMFNVALWVHRIEAMLAVAHLFIIHFFIAHLRRRSFPMDRAMTQGDVDLAHASQEKAAWVERLRSEGRLENMTRPDRSPAVKAVSYVFGLSMVVLGVYILIVGITHAPYASW